MSIKHNAAYVVFNGRQFPVRSITLPTLPDTGNAITLSVDAPGFTVVEASEPAKFDRAKRALEAFGFTDEGGEGWKPVILPSVSQLHDKLVYALGLAISAMDGARGNINPERGFADEVEDELSAALTICDAAMAQVERVSPAQPDADAWEMRAVKEAAKVHDLEQQRDELLASVEAMVSMMDSGDEPGSGYEWHQQAKAAIAKAKGGAS